MRKSPRSTEESERAPARPPEPVADRRRRIDAWIDYFGSGDDTPDSLLSDVKAQSRLGSTRIWRRT